jgi:predicted GH43/DUF377 family glycosyl hydrolase
LTRNPSNPLLRNGPETWDHGKTGPRVVLRVGPGDYRMWYEAVADNQYTTVATAKSADAVTWTKTGVVMSPTAAWEGNEVSPHAILVENAVYKLWYHAGGNQLMNRRIGYATSSDGVTFTRLPQPVLDLGPSGSFDDESVAEPRVINIGNGYRMYYTGRNAATMQTALGMAQSADGINWMKSPANPILDINRWGNFWGGAFFHEYGVWHLWHAIQTGGSSAIVWKWSPDGLTWNDGPSGSVLVPSTDMGAADYGLVGDSVSGFRDGGTYRIMYTGFNWNLFGSQGRFEGICMASIAASCP